MSLTPVRAAFLALMTMSIAVSASSPAASVSTRPAYPDTRREAIVETHFGQKIADRHGQDARR